MAENLGLTINRYKRARVVADKMAEMIAIFEGAIFPEEPTDALLEALMKTCDLGTPPSVETYQLARYLVEEGR